MNIEKTQLNNVTETSNVKPSGKNDFGINFSDELNELKNNVKEPAPEQNADLDKDESKTTKVAEKDNLSEKELIGKTKVELDNAQKMQEKEVLINKNKQEVNIEEKTLPQTLLTQNNPFQNKITPEEILENIQTENSIKNDENKIFQTPEINIKPIIEPNIIPEKEIKLEEKPIQQPQDIVQKPEVDIKQEIERNIIPENEIKLDEKPILQHEETKPIDIKPEIEQNIITKPENIIEEKPIQQPQDIVQKPEVGIKPEIEQNIIPENAIKLEEKPKIQPQEIVKKPEVDIKQNIEPAVKPEIVDKEILVQKEVVKPEQNIKPEEIIIEPNDKLQERIQITPNKNENKKDNSDDEDLGIHIAIADIKNIVNRIKQTDKTKTENNDLKKTDKTKEDEEVINNDFNINENQNKLPQMMPNMNFTGDGQPFSSFVNQEEQQQGNKKLSLNKADLEEEAKILSTMEENIQIANKNISKNKQIKQTEVIKPENTKTEKEPDKVEEKIVSRNDGVKKIDTKTGVTIENIVKYDTVIVSKEDAELFIDIVNQGEVNLNDYSQETVKKASQISKTLADMLAKAKENNQPLRIDFDNNISVIIKVSRDGKISADFLPSSQVAETYLKENLPLLKQRFDEKNIEYDELNQRGRREQEREDRQRKDKNHE